MIAEEDGDLMQSDLMKNQLLIMHQLAVKREDHAVEKLGVLQHWSFCPGKGCNGRFIRLAGKEVLHWR